MGFTGFTQHDFDTFLIEGLEQRMAAIRERIQPKFRAIAEQIADELSVQTGQDMHLHIAKHARRTVNAPVDTWMAFSHNKRGYKQYPHFQVGLFDDRLFVWLALIYEVADKQRIADTLLANQTMVYDQIPDDYNLSIDHMKKSSIAKSSLSSEECKELFVRFKNVKSAELLLGKVLTADEAVQLQGGLVDVVRDTFATLMPIYKMIQ